MEPVSVVLVSVDGSDESIDAATYAVAIADRYDAALHALYVVDEETARAMDEGAVGAETVATVGQDCLDHIDDLATETGVAVSVSTARGYSPRRLDHHPGTVILETAEVVEADFIVLPRTPATEGSVAMLDTAAQYVLAYASQPVLSV